MKKLLIIALVAGTFTYSASAQTEKGRIVVSGKTGLTFNADNHKLYYDGEKVTDGYKTSTLDFSPSVGYFVANNLAVNLNIGLQRATQSSKNMDDYTVTQFSVGPSVTYYFPLSGQVKPFINAGGGFVMQNEKDGTDKSKNDGFAFGGGAGVAIFLKDNISLDLGAGYRHIRLNDGDDRKKQQRTGTVAANVGFSLYF